MNRQISDLTPLTRFLVLTMISLALVLPAACGGGGSGDDVVTVPTIVSTTPFDGASELATSVVVLIEFSEAMNHSSVEGATEVMANGAMPVAATFTWLTGTQLRVNFTKAPGTSYTVTVGTAAKDAEGTALASAYAFTFSTGEPPTVEGTYPLHMATDVALGTTVSVDFSEAMNTVDVDEYVFMSGYSGSVDFAWSVGDTHLMASFLTSLDADTAYTVTILGTIEDAEGTPMGATYTFSFTTGSAFPTGSISGTISDDPDSPYDDEMENTTVALFDMYPFSDTTDGGNPSAAVNCDAAGAYHFSYLPDGSYWLLAIQDSNGDGTITELQAGDSIGVYMSPSFIDSVNVSSGGAESGIDFDLYDPESISGEVSYAGMYTGDLSSLTNSLFFYAYTGDYAIGGTIYLTNDPDIIGISDGDDSANYNESAGSWTYWLTPFFNERISVLGTTDGDSWSGTVTNLDYIPAGSYHVLVRLDHPDGEAFGFAQDDASISGTADDAVGTDVVLYDTMGIYGYAITLDSFDDGTNYPDGKVTLLGWPLMEAPTDFKGSYFQYLAAPISLPVAIHAEPAPSDADDYLAYNTEYMMLDSDSDKEPFEIRFVHWNLLDSMAAMCSYPGAIDPGKAVIAGMVTDDKGDELGGYEVILSGSTPYYITSVGCSTGGVTDGTADGPQFVIFNATIPAGNIGSLAASTGGAITDSVDIPIRSGELTIPRIEISP